MSDLREALEAERAELIAKNEAATSWGAAVGARSERIREIDSALAALSAQPQPDAVEAVKLPVSAHWLGDREAASNTKHAVDERGCVLYFTDQANCIAFMQMLTVGLAHTAPPFAPDERMRMALERSVEAIDDWLNVYASELCHKDRVDDANRRIADAGGTLAYIASVQEQNREALRADEGKESEGGEKAGAPVVSPEVEDTVSSLSQSVDTPRPSAPTPAEQREAVERIVRDQLLQLDLGCGENVNIHDAIAHLRGDADVGHAVELIEDVAAWIADAIPALQTRAGG
jgi:hypothetical protein